MIGNVFPGIEEENFIFPCDVFINNGQELQPTSEIYAKSIIKLLYQVWRFMFFLDEYKYKYEV